LVPRAASHSTDAVSDPAALLPAEALAEMLGRARGENFPVAMRVLPARLRGHLLALYGFARLADELGDEAPGDRLARLDALDRELDRVFSGEPGHPILKRLALTVRACSLPEEPLRRLVEANRRDQRIRRYATWAELSEYCAYSADPVGQLVLHVLGAATPERLALSDRVCTALQLVEHCQDVAEDLGRGRIYLPAEDLALFGCRAEDLAAPRAGPALRALLHFEARRARALLRQGEPLVGTLRGWGRLAVAGFTAGGHAAIDALERRRFDVLSGPPRVRRRGVGRHLLGILWRSRP
jgi:squalene synthase HpnC